jgi:hypothetical protein
MNDGGSASDVVHPDSGVATLCDGSAGLRFLFSDIGVNAGLMEGHALLEENGSSFFMVDGQCRYVSNAGAEGWADYRTGVLSLEEATQLARAVRYGEWSAAGTKLWTNPAINDAGTMAFSDGTVWLGLRGWLSPEGLPDLPAALWNWQNGSFPTVAAAGTPVSGPVRYRVFTREFFGITYPTAAWPLASDVGALAETAQDLGNNVYGKGRLAIGQEAEALRTLRRSYVQQRPGGFPSALDFIPIGTPGQTEPKYLLFVRDTSPFEQITDGLVPNLPR